MTDMEGAINAIMGYYETDENTGEDELVEGAIETLLSDLLEDKVINDLIMGAKSRGTPTTPYLRVIMDDLNILKTTMGGTEYWNIPLKIGSTVKEIERPRIGFAKAVSIVSQARNALLASRQLGIPKIVQKVDSEKIVVVPYAFAISKNKKAEKTYYGAGTILNTQIVINNKD